ncbi:MAG TPA: hypothetical protein VIF38_09785 [Burkholderiales bacterium]|jgi:hypothetical protein
MDLLDLSLLGWLFSIASGLALAAGAWLIVGIYLHDEAARKELAARVLEDSLLFGIWIFGLAGGIGVLLDKSWSRPVLEFFCWVLMALLSLSAFRRWHAAPPPRLALALSLAMFVVPVIAVCVATIVTLRGEAAVRLLAG